MQVNIKPTPIFIHLMIIVSLYNIEAMSITTYSTNGLMISSFLSRYLKEKMKNVSYQKNPLTIVLDNAPKNRIKSIKDLAF